MQRWNLNERNSSWKFVNSITTDLPSIKCLIEYVRSSLDWLSKSLLNYYSFDIPQSAKGKDPDSGLFPTIFFLSSLLFKYLVLSHYQTIFYISIDILWKRNPFLIRKYQFLDKGWGEGFLGKLNIFLYGNVTIYPRFCSDWSDPKSDVFLLYLGLFTGIVYLGLHLREMWLLALVAKKPFEFGKL